MQELICFIYLGYIFPAAHLEDLECICTCWFQPLYASVHTSICEAIKQALTTHVNCVPHNKLYAYLQKKKNAWLLSVLPCVSGILITAGRDAFASSVFFYLSVIWIEVWVFSISFPLSPRLQRLFIWSEWCSYCSEMVENAIDPHTPTVQQLISVSPTRSLSLSMWLPMRCLCW